MSAARTRGIASRSESLDQSVDAAIMLDMPIQGADMRKEPVEIGRFLEDLRIQCAGVPAHDDVADIPENGSGRRARHQPCLALKRGSVLLMM